MAGNHFAGVHIDPSGADLIVEKDKLASSIGGGGGGGVHAATVDAVQCFLNRFNDGGGIPWLRVYQSFPAWQEESKFLE